MKDCWCCEWVYLQGDFLQAFVNNLGVELLFLQLALQLVDSGLQPSLFICQQRTKTKEMRNKSNSNTIEGQI